MELGVAGAGSLAAAGLAGFFRAAPLVTAKVTSAGWFATWQ
jgi:hypothetical protein